MLKKLYAMCLCAILTIFGSIMCFGEVVITSNEGNQELIEMPEVSSDAVLVVDMMTGYTVYEKNILSTHYPASTTKIMTAIIAIENGNLDDNITYSRNAVYSIEVGSSSAYVVEGEQIGFRDSMFGLMVVSANDLAVGIAEHVGGSVEGFADMMNEKAKEIGCTNTHFVNPHGLHDENHYTCALDLGIMAYGAYRDSAFYRELVTTKQYTLAPTNKQTDTRYWSNTNKLLKSNEKFYYPECLGGKSGYTDDAGSTLVSYARINNRYFMVVTLGQKSSSKVYSDHITIYDAIKNTPESYFLKLTKLYQEDKEDYKEVVVIKDKQKEIETVNPDVDNDDNNEDNTKEIVDVNDKKDNGDDNKDSDGVLTIVIRVITIIIVTLVVLYIILRIRVEIRRYKRRKRKRLRQEAIRNARSEMREKHNE